MSWRAALWDLSLSVIKTRGSRRFFQAFARERRRRGSISSVLKQRVENEAVVADSAMANRPGGVKPMAPLRSPQTRSLRVEEPSVAHFQARLEPLPGFDVDVVAPFDNERLAARQPSVKIGRAAKLLDHVDRDIENDVGPAASVEMFRTYAERDRRAGLERARGKRRGRAGARQMNHRRIA